MIIYEVLNFNDNKELEIRLKQLEQLWKLLQEELT